jgi:poly(hydroxyalkanoate) granule-associated protein
MVKRLKAINEKKAASGAGLFDSQLASTVKESAQQIWLAGLGAFSKAQAEGGKVFEALVKEGTSLQRKTQAVAEEKIGDVTNKMSTMAGDVTAKAGQQWDKLESIFEERTAKAMGKLGVPMKKEMDALVKRVEALSETVAKLSKTPRATPKPAAKRPAAKKTSTRSGSSS